MTFGPMELGEDHKYVFSFTFTNFAGRIFTKTFNSFTGFGDVVKISLNQAGMTDYYTWKDIKFSATLE